MASPILRIHLHQIRYVDVVALLGLAGKLEPRLWPIGKTYVYVGLGL
jgi:hypothetical protein